MITTICADLDGTLTDDAKAIHYDCLNMALADIDNKYIISYSDHLIKFDARTTRDKLNILTQERGLPKELHEQIWKDKQKYTEKLLNTRIVRDDELVSMFKTLKDKGYKLFVATNSIRSSTEIMLRNLGIIDILDGYLTNEDVKCGSKPSPSIYLQCMLNSCCEPNQMLVIEDGISGIKAAQSSGAYTLVVKDRSEATLENIMNKINEIDNGKVKKKFPFKGNIVIPMAGASSRFEKAGYSLPKYLLDTVDNKSMIQLVVDSIGLDGHYIYLVRKDHLDKYNLRQMLNLITPGCEIVVVDGITQGAACTLLLSKDLINNDKELFIANSDQYIEWNPSEFFYLMNNQSVSGGILVFENSNVKWSYTKTDKDGYVTEVAEKNPISNQATCGLYYYKKGNEFVKYAEQMINKDIRTNGEFYICPVFSQYIEDGKKIKTFSVDRMIGCGVPEDLNNLINILK